MFSKELLILLALSVVFASMQNERFRMSGKHYFLTFPRCPVDKQLAYDFFMEKHHPEYLLCAHETHADGSPHLHVYLKLCSRKEIRDSQYFDLVIATDRYHGNYQTCRSPSAVQKYARKEGDYVANYDVNSKIPKKDKMRTVAEQIVLGKRRLFDLALEDPELLLGYSRLQQDINCFDRDVQASRVSQLPPFLPNPWGRCLPSKKSAKKRHFWIYSTRPNLGKSFLFAKPLCDEYGAVVQAGDFSYWAVSRGTNCIILDEYNTALLKYSALNSMCDGTYAFRVFHGGVLRLDSPLIIVLSNQSISTLYPFMQDLLYARFIEIKLD